MVIHKRFKTHQLGFDTLQSVISFSPFLLSFVQFPPNLFNPTLPPKLGLQYEATFSFPKSVEVRKKNCRELICRKLKQSIRHLSKSVKRCYKFRHFRVDYLSTYGRETPLYDVGERLGQVSFLKSIFPKVPLGSICQMAFEKLRIRQINLRKNIGYVSNFGSLSSSCCSFRAS